MVILHGDMRITLAGIEPDSIAACVTDPPYELGFMGKHWDKSGVAFDPETWAAVYRVLKPGAHLLAFGGTRTVHRIACAIEDAGFEIRDQIAWMFGSGFPKSLDVSKAIDKRRDDTDPALAVTRWLNAEVKRAGVRYADILRHFGFNEGSGQIGHWTALSIGAQPAVPTWEQWEQLKSLLGFGDEMDAEVWRLNGRKGKPGEAWYEREVIARNERPAGWFTSQDGHDITAPATDLARQWDGWGTALKPGMELVIVARKPLIGTVAANVTTYGTGAINVDGCRIPTDDNLNGGAYSPSVDGMSQNDVYGRYYKKPGEYTQPSGRWPANVALDEDAARLLDAMSGERKSGGGIKTPNGKTHGFVGARTSLRRDVGESWAPDTGGASRFFYCAKSSRRERNAGLDGLPEKMLRWSSGDQNPGSFQSDGTNKHAANHHPTVKPVALMRWLVRLVTPPNGTVLDPFTGSGSTGIAAALEGFGFLGCELNAEYVEIAERRIAHWSREREPDALPLFAGMAAD